jgi:hypothetical protein
MEKITLHRKILCDFHNLPSAILYCSLEISYKCFLPKTEFQGLVFLANFLRNPEDRTSNFGWEVGNNILIFNVLSYSPVKIVLIDMK